MSNFKPAVKHQAKLRLALAGPSGSGKTFTALRIAHRLAEGGRIAYIDTEHGSASKYAGEPNPDGGVFAFDSVDMEPPYHPDRLIALMQEAAGDGYEVLVVDSLSHFWTGQGGLLEEVDKIAARMKTSNTWAAWKDATPIQNRLLDALTSVRLHLIGCMRTKTEWVLEEVEKNGRKTTVPKKVGMAAIQRDGLEYEFDVFADIDLDHRLLVSKSRCRALDGAVVEKPGAEVAETLLAWLGGQPAPEPVAEDEKDRRKVAFREAMVEGKWALNRDAWQEVVKQATDEYDCDPYLASDEQYAELLLWLRNGGQWPKGYKPLSVQAAITDDVEEVFPDSPPAADPSLFPATGTDG